MSAESGRSDADWREWARIHKACWDVDPLVEMHDGDGVQVGFEVDLFARWPDLETSPGRDALFDEIARALHELAERVFPQQDRVERYELAPVESATRLRPETGFAAEIMTTVRVFHKADYFRKVEPGERQRLEPFEHALQSLGLRHGAWPAA